MSSNKTILVTGVSRSANEKTIADFFSFCGKISSLTLKPYGGEQHAVIQFETEAAAKTALLLSNALIVDHPITVAPYVEAEYLAAHPPQVETSPASEANNHSNTAAAGSTHFTGDQLPHKDFGVADEQRSKTSVIASLLASGYILGSDAVAKARDFDEQSGISKNLTEASRAVANKIHEIDHQYMISETATAVASSLGDAVTDAVRGIDEQLLLSEKANVTKDYVSQSVTQGYESLSQKLAQYPSFQSAMGSLSSAVGSLNSYVAPKAQEFSHTLGAEVDSIKRQSAQMIEQTERERQMLATSESSTAFDDPQAAPASCPAPDAATTTPATPAAAHPPPQAPAERGASSAEDLLSFDDQIAHATPMQ